MVSLTLLFIILGFISLFIIICVPNDERCIYCIPYFTVAMLGGTLLITNDESITEENFMFTTGLLVFYYVLGFKYAKICVEIETNKLIKKFYVASISAKLTSEKDYVDSVRLKLYSTKKNMPYLEEKTYEGMVKQFFPTKSEVLLSHYILSTTWLFRIIWDIIISIYQAITINFGENKDINKILKQNPFNEG